jgi:hypothetical protein
MKKLLIISVFLLLLPSFYKAEAATYSAGTLIAREGVEAATVYYIGDDGKKYIFPDSKTYFTWYDNFDDVKKVSLSVLDEYSDGGMVPYRGGVRLITHSNTAKIYAVEPGGIIRWIKKAEIAEDLYGSNWGSFVQDVLPGFFSGSYTLGSEMSNKLPTGTIIKEVGGDNYYYIENGFRRKLSPKALEDNNVNTEFAVELDNLEEYIEGLNVTGEQDELSEAHYRYKHRYHDGGYNNDNDDEEADDNCSSDTWVCGSWGSCQSNNKKQRSCSMTYNCSGVSTLYPITEQSCVYDDGTSDDEEDVIPDEEEVIPGGIASTPLLLFAPLTVGGNTNPTLFLSDCTPSDISNELWICGNNEKDVDAVFKFNYAISARIYADDISLREYLNINSPGDYLIVYAPIGAYDTMFCPGGPRCGLRFTSTKVSPNSSTIISKIKPDFSTINNPPSTSYVCLGASTVEVFFGGLNAHISSLNPEWCIEYNLLDDGTFQTQRISKPR